MKQSNTTKMWAEKFLNKSIYIPKFIFPCWYSLKKNLCILFRVFPVWGPSVELLRFFLNVKWHFNVKWH